MSLAETFAKRYAGLRSAYGTFTSTNETREDGKASGKNITISKNLEEKDVIDLWTKHLNGQQSLGIVPINEDNECVWGAIDVDEYQLDLKSLAIRLAQQQLPLVLCRSKSGGAHIFIFLVEPIPASMLQRKLRQVAAAIGYGQAEIFPKQTKLLLDRGDRGSTLNMPYFGGENSTRYAYGQEGQALTALLPEPSEVMEWLLFRESKSVKSNTSSTVGPLPTDFDTKEKGWNTS